LKWLYYVWLLQDIDRSLNSEWEYVYFIILTACELHFIGIILMKYDYLSLWYDEIW
jgi:hypothetical protein